MPRAKNRQGRECKAEDCANWISEQAHASRLYCSDKCQMLQNSRNRDRRERYTSYGASIDDYDRLFMEQNGCCAICGTDNPGRRGVSRFAFDHDHETNKPRGLLCYLCNVGLGAFQDNPTALWAAIQYLDMHNSFTTIAINPNGSSDPEGIETPSGGKECS